jgi:two-component system NtrC family sensor kinase
MTNAPSAIKPKLPSDYLRSPLTLFSLILGTIFGLEMLSMFLEQILLPNVGILAGNLADSFLLTVMSAPVLWVLIVRPLRSLIDTETEEHKKTIREQLQFLNVLLETLPIPVYFKDSAGRYLGCNSAFAECIGVDRDELRGKTVHEVVPSELADIYAKADEELFQTQVCQVYEGNMEGADGTVRQGIFYKATFRNSDGVLGGLIGVFLDITERKRTEVALAEQKEFSENLIQNSAVAAFVLDREHRVLIWNRACEELTGMRAAEMIGTDEPWKAFFDHKRPVLADLVISSNLEEALSYYGSLAESDLLPEGLQAEGWYSGLNGMDRYISFNAAPIRNRQGELIAVIETLQDLTGRKRSEEQLQESESRLCAILDTTVDGIVIINEHGVIESVNSSCEGIFGYEAGALAGLNVSVLMPPPFREEHDGYLGRYLRTNEKTILDSRREVVARHKDGTIFPVELAVSEVRLGDKRLFTGMITDITERKQKEEDLQRTLSLLNATLESTADGLLVVDREGKIISFNQKFVELWRIPESVLAARNNDQALSFALDQLKNPEEHLAKVRNLYDHPDAESLDILEFRDGRIFYRYSKPQKIGAINVGRVWSYRDITEQRKTEAQLRHAQKMEALGTLAGGVAHDFNNILTAIIGFSSILQRKMDDNDPRLHYLDQILVAAERAAGLTQSLLAYSRKEPLNPCRVDLNDIVRNVGKFLIRLIGDDIDLVTELADEKLTILADSGQMEQVLMNLAANARDAMEGVGSFVISTGTVVLGNEFITRHGYGKPGEYVLLSVADSGAGMDRETMERIFEPFYTTKDPGKGTGLGLSICYGIVKQHDGYINVSSEPGKGTTFQICFPVVASAGETEKNVAVLPVVGGTETILLIEDSGEIRQILREVLTDVGYTVIEAADGQDGVDKFQEHQAEVDLLILDVIMPRKNGRETYDEISAMRSGVRAIFTSGYTADIIGRKGVLGEEYNFIAKPSSPNVLLRKIREVLDTRPLLPSGGNEQGR